jgi:hypothetical protein
MRDMLTPPQAYAHHSALHYDVRRTAHLVRAFYDAAPQSPLWRTLAPDRMGPLRIAAAPWSLFSFASDQLHWQQQSQQRVLPASVQEVCGLWEPGHPMPGRGVRLRNFVYLADDTDLRTKKIDLVVLAKPYTRVFNAQCHRPPNDVTACSPNLTARFGPPIIEDDLIAVYDLRRRYKNAQ